MKIIKGWNIVGLIILLLISCLSWIFARSSSHQPLRIPSPPNYSKGGKQNPKKEIHFNGHSQRQIARYLPLLKNNPFLPPWKKSRTVSPLSSNPLGPLPPLDPAHLELRKNIVSSYKNWVYAGYAETEEGPIALLEHQKTKQGRFLSLGGQLEEAKVFLLSPTTLWLTDHAGKKYILPLNQPNLSPPTSKEGAKGEKGKSPASSPPSGGGSSSVPGNINAPYLPPPIKPFPPQSVGLDQAGIKKPVGLDQEGAKKLEINGEQGFQQPLPMKIEKQ